MAIDIHQPASRGGAPQDLKRRRAGRRGSRPVRKAVSQKNRINIALPHSMMKVGAPTAPGAGDWISLARLVASVIGFSIVIRQLARTGKTQAEDQATRSA